MLTFNMLRQLLSCVDGLHSDVRELAPRVQLLVRQVEARSAQVPSSHGDMTWLEESVAIAQLHLAEAQPALITV